MSLLEEHAAGWADVALRNIEREYPNVRLYLAQGPEDRPPRPREQFPAFYGSYDWHSCVEMHWVLVRLLRLVPEAIGEDRVRAELDRHLAEEALAVEARNLPRWERPYGYGWTLKLAHELSGLGDGDAKRWAANLEPLCDRIVDDFLGWFEVATYPVRSGLHANSAFGLSLALCYGRTHRPRLAAAITRAARRWFGSDTDYPGHYEPSGTDFLSPALTEAELMLEVLGSEEFGPWFGSYLPRLAEGRPEQLFEPVEVTDPTDGQIAHLHGLNLSRAWCWTRLARALPATDPRRERMLTAAARHRDASLDHSVGSDYMVEHWLAAYALLLVSEGG